MKESNTNIQDPYLNELRTKNALVTVLFCDGSQLKGTIKAFDNFTIQLDGEENHLIYKHAIIRITPQA